MALVGGPVAAQQQQPCYEVKTFAGRGIGDGGPATSAVLASPRSAVVDAGGNIFFADGDNARVRRIDANGTITTVAGNGAPGQAVEGAAATATTLKEPTGVAVDAQGNLYVVDSGGNTVWKIGADGILHRAAGNGIATGSIDGDHPGGPGNNPDDDLNDGQQAIFATLNRPTRVVVDQGGNLIISDLGNTRIRRVDAASGRIATLVTAAEGLSDPVGLALAANGDLYVANRGRNQVVKITGNTLTVVVNASGVAGPNGDGGPALAAQLNQAADVSIDPTSGALYIADTASNWIRKVDTNGVITRVVGDGNIGDRDGPGFRTEFFHPGVTVAPDATLIIPDADNNKIKRYDVAADDTSTIAGGADLPGDGGPATAALLNRPTGLAVDAGGNVYVTEHDSHRVRRIDPTGIITTIVNEQGLSGSPVDGSAARSSALNKPTGIEIDPSGNILIADAGSDTADARVLLVDPAGILHFFAGNGTPGFGGDGGPAPAAMLNTPLRVAVGSDGSVYIADFNNNRIRRVGTDGTMSTFAGPETGAGLSQPSGLAFDGSGNLYVADFSNNRVVRLDQNGLLAVVGGGGAPGSSGDGGPVSAAHFNGPTDVIVATDGAVLVVDQNNNKVRRIAVDDNGAISGASIVTTLMGNGRAGFHDGPADQASFLIPTDIAIQGANVLIADRGNQLVRIATPGTGCGQAGTTCTTAADCDDGDVCTTDSCGADGRCVHDPVNTPACRPTCATEPDGCIPGGGPAKSDCLAELVVRGPHTIRGGKPAPSVRCKDGDTSCDFDTVQGQCTFRVAWCLNVTDPRLACTSPGVTQQTLSGPTQAMFLNALVQLAPQNASQAGRGVVFSPAMTTPDVCTPLQSVTVALKKNGRRPGKMQIRGTAVAGGKPRRRDVDNVRLVCLP